jgi:lysophospholipase L1-like esterase
VNVTWAGAEYVALGSSFAAGPGIGRRVPGTPRRAARSQSNYAHLLARELGLRLRDVTSSGATTAELLTERQYDQPRQLDAVGAETRLVTITGAGNDAGYVQALLAASVVQLLGRVPGLGRLPGVGRAAEQSLDPTAVDERLAPIADRLAEVAVQIQERAPQARIVFVDYLTLIPEDPRAYRLPMSPEHAGLARSIGDRLEAATATAAASTGSDLVRASVASRDHHPWSSRPWTSGFFVPLPFRRRGAPFHPNQDGMQAVAGLLAEHLTSG